MMELDEVIRIPEERVDEFLKVKAEVEDKIPVSFEVRVNEISVSGESLELLKARSIVLAVGRGFTGREALFLLSDDYCLDVVDVDDFARTKNSMVRLKGRVIGESGRSKRFIEKHTGCLISVYGKTVSLIGKPEDLVKARKAVVMLLEGAKHGTVYRFLERKD